MMINFFSAQLKVLFFHALKPLTFAVHYCFCTTLRLKEKLIHSSLELYVRNHWRVYGFVLLNEPR